MFGAKYSRMKFWLVYIPALFIGSLLMGMTNSAEIAIINAIISLIVYAILINTLANRIRDFGSNPWFALWALLPLVGFIQALYYGCKESRKTLSEHS